MAVSPVNRGSTSPESNPHPNTSRRRHHGKSRPEYKSRRSKSEHTHTYSQSQVPYSKRASPPRQFQAPSQWCQSPTMSSYTPIPIPSHSTSHLSSPLEHTVMAGITMERTPSGNSIMSDSPINYSTHHSNHTLICADSEAARRVEKHFHHNKRLSSSSHRKHERILKTLIRSEDRYIDDNTLDGILTTADTLFFDGVLSKRVQWEWSWDPRYRHELIGTTALRRCPDRDGFETLIVLSAPILLHQHSSPNGEKPFLLSEEFDRRLLLSTFLHELIHCYLFISCGFEARMQGGHTEGFHRIAGLMDEWVGGGYLSLCHVKANLDSFRRRDVGLVKQEEAWPMERGPSRRSDVGVFDDEGWVDRSGSEAFERSSSRGVFMDPRDYVSSVYF